MTGLPTVKIDGNNDAAYGNADCDINGVATTAVSGNDYKITFTVPTFITLPLDGAVPTTIKVSGTDYLGNVATDADVTGEAYYDNTAPTQAAPTLLLALLNNVVANYYNSTNDGFRIVVPIADDATLFDGVSGGSYVVEYDINDVGTFVASLFPNCNNCKKYKFK